MRGATLFAGLLAHFALAVPGPVVEKRQTPGCKFDSEKSPECWDGVFNINSNYYEEGPDTGKIKEYFFELTNLNKAPDGVEKMVLAINGQIPGPTIYADWGDTVVVHVKNNLTLHNGTSIHFHGVRQLNTNAHEGVVAITQCPTAPGESITYKWKASQYGTSWYHSHYALQPWDGVFGGIVINGPASSKYHEDLGVVTLGDWFHNTTDELYPAAKLGRVPSPPNGLVNGTNVFNNGGKRFVAKFKKNNRYRMRLINHSMDMHFKVKLDGHTFEVIATDFVPIKPFTAEILTIGIGQRLDVIVEATADVGEGAGNYWLHAVPRCAPGTGNTLTNIKGIIRYEGATETEPSGPNPTIPGTDCLDFPMASLVPVLSLPAGGSDRNETFQPGFSNNLWRLGQQSFLTNWSNPTVEQVLDGKTSFTGPQTVVKLDESRKWVYFIINSNIGTHPIHLHGHDFWVLAQGTGAFNPSSIRTENVPRRDVAMLPGGGHLVLGFPTDNPGVWLMHCHIGWHASLGFALQLVERISEIPGTADMNKDFLEKQCDPWRKYAAKHNIIQDDSGI